LPEAFGHILSTPPLPHVQGAGIIGTSLRVGHSSTQTPPHLARRLRRYLGLRLGRLAASHKQA